MENLKELQTKESLERLKILHKQYELMDIPIKEFETESIVYYSEYINNIHQGILYWISNKEEFVNTIKEFEEEHQAVVYHAILTPMTFGRILNLLYVSRYQEEWELDRTDLEEGLPIAYCANIDDDSNSEFGTIEITGVNGGITRIN